MSMKDHVHRIREELPAVILFLAMLWGVFLLDRLLPLERFGLVPRDLEKRTVPLLVSVLVALLHGSTLLTGILPWQRGVSWNGYFFGSIAGAAVAWLLVSKPARK
ncbi:MAG: hypothetical protein ACK4RS_07790 [Thiothrix sp.]